jgi:hypothetical protein
MQFPIEPDQIIAVALGSGAFLLVIMVWLGLVGRRLERAWRLVDTHWKTVRARLKERGDLLPELARVTRYRLTRQRESLEVLARLRTRSISGRNPPERAAAEADLETVLRRVLAAAMADPGLAGVTEFESVRAALEDRTRDIRRAAAIYNDAVANYNRSTERFPASMLSRRMGAGKAEFFDDGKGTFLESGRDGREIVEAGGQPQTQ